MKFHKYLILNEIRNSFPTSGERAKRNIKIGTNAFSKLYPYLRNEGFILTKALRGSRRILSLSMKGHKYVCVWKNFIEKIEDLDNVK